MSQDIPQTRTIDTVDELGTMFMGWHKNTVAHMEHLLEVPDGTAMEVGDDPIVLTGDALAGFKLGIELCLMQAKALPFAPHIEEEEEAPTPG